MRSYLQMRPGMYVVQVGSLVKIGRAKNLRGRLKCYVHDGLSAGLIFPADTVDPQQMGHPPELRAAETFALGLANRLHGAPARGAEYFDGLELERAGEFVRAAMRTHDWPDVETLELDVPALAAPGPAFGRSRALPRDVVELMTGTAS